MRKTCIMGSRTDSPCPYPVVNHVPRGSLEEPRLCAYHAATEPLVEEETDLNLALDLFDEWEQLAHIRDNRPLRDLLSRARQEFGQRLAFVERVLEDLQVADEEWLRR